MLKRWSERLRELESRADNVFAYFNSDTAAPAPKDAATLRTMLRS